MREAAKISELAFAKWENRKGKNPSAMATRAKMLTYHCSSRRYPAGNI